MSIPAHERLLDLIIALTRARPALTRAQIRSEVNGYSPLDGDSRTDAAFERMFERDKETLKELGIPLLTLYGSVHHDEVGYRVDLSDYRLPDIELSAAELGVLAVATKLWEGSVMSRQARRGLTKLKGVTLTPPETDFQPVVHLHEPDTALPSLLDAITHRQPVRFTYRAGYSGEEATRDVEPWRLSAKHQGWYLQGFDRNRNAPREFRLSRITSTVATIGDPGSVDDAPAVPEPISTERYRVRLAIKPDAAALLRARGDLVGQIEGRDIVELVVVDLGRFRSEVSAYADAVVVLGPESLREEVVAEFSALAKEQT